MLPWPVLGSRTWMWAMAAPALAAPIAASAISLGFVGTAGCLPIGPPPVTAQVMMVFAMMRSSLLRHSSKRDGPAGLRYPPPPRDPLASGRPKRARLADSSGTHDHGRR